MFVLRRLAEKSISKNKLLFVFIDRVPREFIRSALRRKGVPKHLVNGVMTLYKGCKTAAPVEGELSGSFSVKVGVHQASALNPLLPVSVIDVLTEDLKEGSLMELLHANNLALRGKHLDDIMGQYLRKTGEGIRRKASRLMLKRQEECSYYMVRKLLFRRWILALPVVNRLVVVTLFGVKNVRNRFIVISHLRLGGSVYFLFKMSLSVRHVWVITAQ